MVSFNIMEEEILITGVTVIRNLIDKSSIIYPYFEYDPLDNTSIGFSIYFIEGKKGRDFSPDNY